MIPPLSCPRLRPVSAGSNEILIETASSPGPFRNTHMSKAAQTHKLRKLRAPSKCRECDSLVVFHGAECEEVTARLLLLINQEKKKKRSGIGLDWKLTMGCVCPAVFSSLP